MLDSFLNHLNRARASSTTIDKIDCALSTGDFEQLMLLTGTKDFQQVLHIEESMSYQMSRQENRLATSKLRDPNIEAKTLLKHTTSLAEFQKAVDDQATIAYISCERLLRRSAVVRISLSDPTLDGPFGDGLKAHVQEQNPSASDEQLLSSCSSVRTASLILFVVTCPTAVSSMDSSQLQFLKKWKI